MEQLLQRIKLNFSDVPDPRGQSAPDTPRSSEADLAAHEAAADPHPGYLTAAEGAGLFAASSHTHTAAAIIDFVEASQDVVGAMIAAAGGTYDDPAGTITLPGGGGGVNSGKTTVDFGAFPGASDAKVTIAGQAGILTTSKVKAYLMAEATADHTADEHWIEQIEVMAGNIVAGTGFDIYARCTATLSEPVPEQWAETRLAGPGTGVRQIRPSRSAGLLPRIYGQFTVAWEWV